MQIAGVQNKVSTHYVLLFTEIAKRAGVPDFEERARVVFQRFRYWYPLDETTVSLVFDALVQP